jgi:hypothetical protein
MKFSNVKREFSREEKKGEPKFAQGLSKFKIFEPLKLHF